MFASGAVRCALSLARSLSVCFSSSLALTFSLSQSLTHALCVAVRYPAATDREDILPQMRRYLLSEAEPSHECAAHRQQIVLSSPSRAQQLITSWCVRGCADLDGCYFGTTFPHLFLHMYGDQQPVRSDRRTFPFSIHLLILN
jgi:hypothetical protein